MTRIISVVLISLCLMLSSNVFAGKSYWTCSSFFINKDGYLGTAGHCVEGSKNLYVIIDNDMYPAEVVVADYQNDVAIIKIDRKTPKYLDLALAPNDDQIIYILGYPLPDVRGWNLKVKKGRVVDSDGGYYTAEGGSCQGNSGGAVVNSSNNVVGVLTFGVGSSPCAYYVGIQKIRHLIVLAQIYDVRVTIPVASSARIYNTKTILDLDIKRVPILLGNN